MSRRNRLRSHSESGNSSMDEKEIERLQVCAKKLGCIAKNKLKCSVRKHYNFPWIQSHSESGKSSMDEKEIERLQVWTKKLGC
jgi:uncharacterized phage-associated protein